MPRLQHLNLTVADLPRSIAFYRRWFGFERELARYPDGTVFVTDDHGFELALHPGSPRPGEHWHFGFTFDDRAAVVELRAAFEDAGIAVVDAHDTAAYVGFKVQDPDGHWIEAYHEPRA